MVICEGKPGMTRTGNHHSFDMSVFIVQREKKSLRLIVMYYSILFSVYD